MRLRYVEAMALLVGGGGRGSRVEVHDEALAVEAGDVVSGNLDAGIGVVCGVEVERQGGLTLYAGSLAKIVDLGIAVVLFYLLILSHFA